MHLLDPREHSSIIVVVIQFDWMITEETSRGHFAKSIWINE